MEYKDELLTMHTAVSYIANNADMVINALNRAIDTDELSRDDSQLINRFISDIGFQVGTVAKAHRVVRKQIFTLKPGEKPNE